MPTRLFASFAVIGLAAGLAAQNCPVQEGQVAAPIRLVTFSNAELVSFEQREEIAKAIRDRMVDSKSLAREVDSLAEEFRERVRMLYQNQGYFQAKVTVQKHRTVADPGWFDLEAQVETTGLEYRLGEITFLDASAFPATQLRSLFQIERGEIFSREKIAGGLGRLRRLYGSEGYIGFTAIPNTTFDGKAATANLSIDIHEGKPFHVHSVKVGGVDPQTAFRIRKEWDLAPGDIFRLEDPPTVVSKLSKAVENATATLSYRTLDDEWVDVALDFRKNDLCR